MKTVMIILGNGFSIDFLKHVEKDSEINVSNLFQYGESVPWPVDGKSGFLSYKYCPNLWNLGARPFLCAEESIILIEDIITCANILQSGKRKEQNIYIKAYKELAQYLYSLFIFYDKKIIFNPSQLKQLPDWGWYRYLKSLNENSEIEKVHIITFNYDIWLEKVLRILGADFNVVGFETKAAKFQIYKPHGSISFQSKVRKDKYAYQIDYSTDVIDDDVDKFNISYDNINPLNVINAIIPPAGDSNRLSFKWASNIREKAKETAKLLKSDDELILSGLSYWHVDRLEIDSILTEIQPEINNVKIINPKPPKVLNAVMTTLFKNVIFYTNCKNLSE